MREDRKVAMRRVCLFGTPAEIIGIYEMRKAGSGLDKDTSNAAV